MEKKTIKFISSHGIVHGYEGECVSITFGMSKNGINGLPHTPTMKGGLLKSLTTMCDHDIGVIVNDE